MLQSILMGLPNTLPVLQSALTGLPSALTMLQSILMGLPSTLTTLQNTLMGLQNTLIVFQSTLTGLQNGRQNRAGTLVLHHKNLIIKQIITNHLKTNIMAEGRFSTKDADFSNDLNTIVPHLNSEAARLQVAATRLSQLNDLKTDWDDLFPKSTNPSTSTKTIRDTKNQTRQNMEALLREIYDDIPNSVLTNDDRDKLNLPERDSIPTPRPSIGTEPGVIVNSRAGRKIDVECRVSGDSSRPSRHPDSDAIEWRANVAPMPRTGGSETPPPMAPPVGGTTAEPPATDTRQAAAPAFRTGIVSRAKFTIQLPETDAGMMAAIQCRWVNITDSTKSGEWSAAVSIMVMA